MNHRLLVSISGVILLLLAGCADTRHRLIVSVPDQKMLVLTDGKPEAIFAVSTSKFGTGDREGSYATPLGHLCVLRIQFDAHKVPMIAQRHHAGCA